MDNVLFNTYQWFIICGSVVVGVATSVLFMFNNFVTCREYKSKSDDTKERLDRIEQKLDRLLEGKG